MEEMSPELDLLDQLLTRPMPLDLALTILKDDAARASRVLQIYIKNDLVSLVEGEDTSSGPLPAWRALEIVRDPSLWPERAGDKPRWYLDITDKGAKAWEHDSDGFFDRFFRGE